MKVNVKTNGKKVLASIGRIDKELREKTKKALRQSTAVVLSKAIDEAPIGNYTGGGGLKQSIKGDFSRLNSLKTYIYTAGKKYAEWIHEGTGIYGKYKTAIRPKKSKVLRFKVNGKWISAKSVKGVKPNPYLTRALEKSIPSIKSIFRHYFKK